jgi:integrase
MYSALFRVLYCCGLRISEALNLHHEDVNLKDGVLIIKSSKFDKDRLVPMSESLRVIVQEFMVTAQLQYPNNNHLFPSRHFGRAANARCVHAYFKKMLFKSQISYEGRGKGPRLHDFRHTFSVHALQKWVSEEIDVYVALPILATYLGHKDTRMTQRYLRLTADIFPNVLEMSESYSGEVIPEVAL